MRNSDGTIKELEADVVQLREALTTAERRLAAARAQLPVAAAGFECDRIDCAIRDSEARLRDILGGFEGNAALLSTSGDVLEMNHLPLAEAMGFRRDDLIGRNIFDVLPVRGDLLDRLRDALTRAATGELVRYEAGFGAAAGPSHVEVTLAPRRDRDGTITAIAVFSVDVTRMRHADEQLRDSLRDKEVLLHEVFHRVKNNLQVVASMLFLQSRRADARTGAALNDMRARVQAMSLAHELVYRAESIEQLDAERFVTRIVWNAVSAFRSEAQVRVAIEVPRATLSLATAVPFGLIVNELVSNAMKHAFKRASGRLGVSLLPMDDGRHELRIVDDGPGMDPTSVGDESLGLRLVRRLVDQIGGELAFDAGPGTHVVVRAPLDRIKR